MSNIPKPRGAGPWRNPPRVAAGWRPEDWALLALFLLAALAASPLGHGLAILAMISIIGLPIYFILAALPGLFVYALLLRLGVQTWLSWRAGRLLGVAAFGVATALLADLLVFGAWRENYRLDSMASGLLAQDRDDLAAGAKPGALAVVRNARQPRDTDTLCDDLCLRLLLNGAAARVIAVALAPPEPPPRTDRRTKRPNSTPARPEWPALDFDPAQPGALYWLEPREVCPDVKIAEGLRPLTLPPERREAGQPALRRATRSDEAMRLKIAAGTCLMSRPATLAEADAALAYGALRSGEGPYSAAEKLSADTISAWRIAYAAKRGAGFEEVYRATGISLYRFPWLRIPFYVHGYQFAMKIGWLRAHALLGARRNHQDKPPVEAFLTERLGATLRLDEGQGPAGGGGAVARILASAGAPPENDAMIVRDFIAHAGAMAGGRNVRLSPQDADLVVRIAADERIALDWRFGGAAAAVSRDAPQLGGELARLLFARLDRLTDTPAEGQEETRWRESAGAIAGSLARLSDDHLRPFRAAMEKLARTPRKRDRAGALLRRLDMFGPGIAPLLLEIMQTSAADAQAETRQPQRRRAQRGAEGYSAALGAFCRLGPRAEASLDALARELQAPDNPLLRRNEEKAIAALAQMGAGEDRVREVMKIDGADAKALQRFGFAMRRAQGRHACA